MSEQETFPVGARVRKHTSFALWHGVIGRVVAVTEATPAMVRVQWANWPGMVWERADDLLPVPEPPRDDDSAERSERVSDDQEQFPAGTRVRWRGRPDSVCTVESEATLDGTVRVQLGDGMTIYCWPRELERLGAPEPPRAPIRTLAPGVEQSDDVCDGKPRIAGTGISTQALYAFWNEARIDWPDIKNSYDVTAEQHHLAIAFEAGRAWERERRRRRKERRAVRRYERARALAEASEP